uniref:Tc1-like transposase DDE domain-containing protein n=1 Tax=Tetranychus urticae TaxID=32264 RepID=A0A158P4D1_TETUR
MKMGKPKISDHIKELVVKADGDGLTCSSIAQLYNINVNTVRTIIHRFKLNQVISKPRGKKPKKLNEEMVAKIREWFDEDCQLTLDDVKDKLNGDFNIDVCINTIRNRIRNELFFSFKRISLVPARRNDPSTIQRRKQYVKAVRGKSYSICAVMDNQSLYLYEAKEKGYNTVDFVDFLKKFLDHLKNDNIENSVIIMDNVPFHHATPVNELFATESHQLLFLPPYSPFLNPIENLFNQLKHWVKKFRPSSADDVFRGVELASDIITANDCQKYFDHMMKYIPKCVQEENIEN